MSNISKIGILKGLMELVVAGGSGIVIGNIIQATTPSDMNRFQKVLVAAGGWSISAVLGDLAAKHVGSQIDDYADKFNAIINPTILVEPDVEVDEAPVAVKAKATKSTDISTPDEN
tara:strand:+ start:124 stop:471 length:348 start_codon:yes stop_codon:yes gene_type:complete